MMLSSEKIRGSLDHAVAMNRTYTAGEFAAIVAAGGNEGFLNLGCASTPIAVESTRQRQIQMADRITADLTRTLSVTNIHRRRPVVLDLGCGRGGVLGLLAGNDAELIGLNIDSDQLSAARQMVKDRTEGASFVCGNAEELPFRDDTVDIIFMVELLSHVQDKTALCEEVTRTLRTGGSVVVAVITLTRPYADFPAQQQEYLARVAAFFAERPVDIPTFSALSKTLEATGLVLEFDNDLTDLVFPPRHQEFVSILRDATDPDPTIRQTLETKAREEWQVTLSALIPFLRANVEHHPCRFYEYHLARWHKPLSRRNEQ